MENITITNCNNNNANADLCLLEALQLHVFVQHLLYPIVCPLQQASYMKANALEVMNIVDVLHVDPNYSVSDDQMTLFLVSVMFFPMYTCSWNDMYMYAKIMVQPK